MFVLPSRRVCSTSHSSVKGRDISLPPDSACSLETLMVLILGTPVHRAEI